MLHSRAISISFLFRTIPSCAVPPLALREYEWLPPAGWPAEEAVLPSEGEPIDVPAEIGALTEPRAVVRARRHRARCERSVAPRSAADVGVTSRTGNRRRRTPFARIMYHSSAAVPFASASAPLIAGALFAVLISSCASQPVQAKPAEAIHRSTGTSIEFRWEGTPTDMPASADGILTLPNVLRQALEASPEVQAALARVRAEQADADLASLLPNPVLSLVVRFPEGGGGTQIETGLAADLLAILQRPRRARIAGHRLEAESAQALTTALDLVIKVEQRYLSVQSLEELLAFLEQRMTVLERLREVAQVRLEVGEGTRHDVTTLDSERITLEVEIAAQRQELRIARLALARVIGEPSSAADWKLEPWIVPSPVEATEQAWIDTALSNRPEVLAIQWELRAREEEESLARGGVLQGASVGLDAERDAEWSLGPAVSTPLPIFDTGRARRDRARALSAEDRHRLTEAQRTVIEDVRASLAALVGLQEILARVDQDLLPLQTRRRSEIEEAFNSGFVDVTALLFADQALQETQVRRVELARDLALAQFRLERSVGGPVLFQSVSQGAH